MAIKSFKSKELEDFFYDGKTKGLNANHCNKIGRILDSIEASHRPCDLKVVYPSFSAKVGGGKGVYSINVSGNWRLTFQIIDDGAVLLDYLDYHGKQIKAQKL